MTTNEQDRAARTNLIAALYIAAQKATDASVDVENYTCHPGADPDDLAAFIAVETDARSTVLDLTIELCHEIGISWSAVDRAIAQYNLDERNTLHPNGFSQAWADEKAADDAKGAAR